MSQTGGSHKSVQSVSAKDAVIGLLAAAPELTSSSAPLVDSNMRGEQLIDYRLNRE